MVREVLDESGSGLENLLKYASQLERLENLLRGLVGADLADHFQVAAVRKNRLVLITPTASWATRFRMHASHIVDSLHNAGVSTIEHIDIRVAPLVEQQQKNRTPRALSPAAEQALNHMAQLKNSGTK